MASCVYRLRTLISNVYFVGHETGGWTLVDCGILGYTRTIRREAERLFGRQRPTGIVLTHGHFDHVGALPALAAAWGVPVYAHPLELPFLTGARKYPPPDPTVGGGLMATLSPLYSRGPIDLGARVQPLPERGYLPGMNGWRWIHTPGHTDGHVALFHDDSRVLIAGDAVVATKQESFLSVASQQEVVWRPPAYFTTDWEAARQSVRTLADLEPELLATGHGHVLRGEGMRRGLRELADRFADYVPGRGRYVRPADHYGWRGGGAGEAAVLGARVSTAAAVAMVGAAAAALVMSGRHPARPASRARR